MIEDYFRRSPRISAAKIRNRAQLGELPSRVRVVEGYYNLATGKVEWAAK
jgi:hypothetical protein